MNYDYSNLVTLFEGLGGFTAAAAAGCASHAFWLKKQLGTRLTALELRPEAAPGDSLEDVRALAARVSSMQSSISVLQSGMAAMQTGLASMNSREDHGRPETDPLPAGKSGIDSDRRKPRFQTEWNSIAPLNSNNRRGQMLRMHRRGESVPAIASALGISQGEVKLTVRLQELSSEMPEEENSQDRF